LPAFGSRSFYWRIFIPVRFLNLYARHAITAVPGTPAGFPESNFLKIGFRFSALGFRKPETGCHF
jgi:hypothetical protein